MNALLQIAIFTVVFTLAMIFTDWIVKRVERGKTSSDLAFGLIAMSMVLMAINGCLFGAINSSEYIPPIEVYRGRTEMVINTKTVGDSVITKDTAVVWKKGYGDRK